MAMTKQQLVAELFRMPAQPDGEPGSRLLLEIIDWAESLIVGAGLSQDADYEISGDWTFTGVTNIGDPGFETAGVSVNGEMFEAVLKVNDFGSGSDVELALHRHSNTDAGHFVISRARGNTEVHEDVQQGDGIGAIAFTGWNTDTYNMGAMVKAQVSGTPSADSMPCSVLWYTSPVGSRNPQLAVTFDHNQDVVVQNTLKTNTIAERSSAAGVTIDGLLLKDGGVGDLTSSDLAQLKALATLLASATEGQTLVRGATAWELAGP